MKPKVPESSVCFLLPTVMLRHLWLKLGVAAAETACLSPSGARGCLHPSLLADRKKL